MNSNRYENGLENYGNAVIEGLIRNHLFVLPSTHWINTLKYQLQSGPAEQKIGSIWREIIAKEGYRGLYSGYIDHMRITSKKQLWQWPIMVCVPEWLEKSGGLNPYCSRFFAGMFQGSVDAIFTLRDSGNMIQTMVWRSQEGQEIEIARNWKTLLKSAKMGFLTLWALNTSTATTFLISQKYLRDHYPRNPENPKLALFDYALLGVATSLCVSAVRAPFDLLNTVCLANSGDLSHLTNQWGRLDLKRSWGTIRATWPLIFTTSVIQNFSSLFFMEMRERERMPNWIREITS